MPGNTILINKSKDLEWYVGDSQMDSLIEWLNEKGIKIENDNDKGDRMSEKIAQVKIWLNNLIYPGKYDDFIEVIKEYKNEDECFLKVCFYTEEHQYFIRAVDRKDDDGYLGCTVSCRKPRAGEDWTRGNDLPDGPLNENTWNGILKAIIRYEIIKLSEYRKPDYMPDEVEEVEVTGSSLGEEE